ncbi:PspC domain-containing protein [Paludibacter jiangxiensis]|uniref:Phage shock protein PspC n=1 Tax=Paludibacter jiangxiensis TaxID=681398 RepID=A0A171ALF1_9BACT|nr:PspC domain-containing protein [Paludibacter jiangxiensis]MDP4201968.1 PspC domain-containing protein [Bacteroidota bacterium]GAT63928.1 phage shock protein PspC [Paludibacter jiangxiensis]
MKKTISINLNCTVFQIDEDAYQALSEYLDAVSKHLQEENGQSEIMTDIEARIAELFTERLNKSGQVVTIELVNDIIGIMGRPSDYGEEEPGTEEKKESTSTYYHSSSKRIYRDPEKALLGGVLSGFSIYLGIDVVWLRIIFALLVIFGVGTVIPIYLVLWIVIPKAETTAQRMEMQGIDVTIENIKAEANKVKERFQDYVKPENIDKKKEQIKAEAYRVKDNVEGYVRSNEFQHGVQEVGSTANRVARGFFKGLFAFIAGVVGLTGAIIVMGLVIALILSLIEPSWFFVHFPNEAVSACFLSTGNIAMVLVALLVLIGVPVYMLFYIAIKVLSGDAHLSSTSKWVALLLWLAGLFLLVSLSSQFAYLHWFTDLL